MMAGMCLILANSSWQPKCYCLTSDTFKNGIPLYWLSEVAEEVLLERQGPPQWFVKALVSKLI